MWAEVVGICSPHSHRLAFSGPNLLTAMFAGQATINVEFAEVGRSGVAWYVNTHSRVRRSQGNLRPLNGVKSFVNHLINTTRQTYIGYPMDLLTSRLATR